MNYKNYIELKRELKRLYPQSIIVLKFYKTPDKHIYLHKISLPEQYKNKGIGIKIMNILCRFGDNNKINIMLEPTDSFGSDLSRLIKFYESFGFVKYRNEMLRKYTN